MIRSVRPATTGFRSVKHFLRPILIGSAALLAPLHAFADQHTSGAPALSSNPGAAYTIYLDFSGFNYTGTWDNKAPGAVPAYADVAATGSFNAQQIADIRTTFAGVAMQYAAFNINVTTLDPAIAAGQNGTDVARQTYYNATPNLMHTIYGSQVRGNTDWYGPGVAGVSNQGTTTGNDPNPTFNLAENHTNWAFTAGTSFNMVGNTQYLINDATHENGHGLGLGHQSDFNGTTLINDYGLGDNQASTTNRNSLPSLPRGAKPPTGRALTANLRDDANAETRVNSVNGSSFRRNTGAGTSGPLTSRLEPSATERVGPTTSTESSTGPGTYGSIMGDGNSAQRLGWRVGSTSDSPTGATQNDVGRILSTNTAANAALQGRTGGVDLHLVNDGIGHSIPTATTLGMLSGGRLDFNLNKGVIVPLSETNPNPIGKANYTSDFFKFTLSATSTVTLTTNNGSEYITPGTADPQVTLRSTMTILTAAGLIVGTGTEATDTLSETFARTLIPGTYLIRIESFGGHNQVNDPAAGFTPSTYFDMGAYFLTGSINAVPEPGTWAMIAIGVGLMGVTLRRRVRRG